MTKLKCEKCNGVFDDNQATLVGEECPLCHKIGVARRVRK